jgi:hypothetical protein
MLSWREGFVMAERPGNVTLALEKEPAKKTSPVLES